MAEKFKNKYRIQSSRQPDWDYRTAGAYFITICTKDREHYFGKVRDGKMILSPLGVLADVMWHEIKFHSKHVSLGAFVVMPHHVHGILILGDNDEVARPRPIDTLHATCLSGEKNAQMSAISPKSGSVSAIVRAYKSAVTKHANRMGLVFAWQTRFHDSIIRNSQSYARVTLYIRNNPLNWATRKQLRSA